MVSDYRVKRYLTVLSNLPLPPPPYPLPLLLPVPNKRPCGFRGRYTPCLLTTTYYYATISFIRDNEVGYAGNGMIHRICTILSLSFITQLTRDQSVWEQCGGGVTASRAARWPWNFPQECVLFTQVLFFFFLSFFFPPFLFFPFSW